MGAKGGASTNITAESSGAESAAEVETALPIVTIDFEASCLPKHGRSYPIEVGIAGPGVPARSWIIRPHAVWADWDWTSEAEGLHGLTLDEIKRIGRPASEVLLELSDAVAGHRVIADSMLDQYWLETLASAARMPPRFCIDHIASLLDECGVDELRIMEALAFANCRFPARHHARADALWLSAIVVQVTGQSFDAAEAPVMLSQC